MPNHKSPRSPAQTQPEKPALAHAFSPAAPPDRPRLRASAAAHPDGPALPAAKPRPQGRRLAAEIERLETELRAAQAGLAELQALVDVDSLTGIFNRRGFERELERALAFAARYGNAAALVFVDLDGFKLVNDVYGHGAGDVVLQGVAAVLQRIVRGSDTVARIGGDEFALLLWNLDGKQAAMKARAVQDALAQMRTQHEGRTIEVGASAGVAVIASGDTLAHAMARADAAMYEDKRARQCAGPRQAGGRKKGTA